MHTIDFIIPHLSVLLYYVMSTDMLIYSRVLTAGTYKCLLALVCCSIKAYCDQPNEVIDLPFPTGCHYIATEMGLF